MLNDIFFILSLVVVSYTIAYLYIQYRNQLNINNEQRKTNQELIKEISILCTSENKVPTNHFLDSTYRTYFINDTSYWYDILGEYDSDMIITLLKSCGAINVHLNYKSLELTNCPKVVYFKANDNIINKARERFQRYYKCEFAFSKQLENTYYVTYFDINDEDPTICIQELNGEKENFNKDYPHLSNELEDSSLEEEKYVFTGISFKLINQLNETVLLLGNES